MNKDKIDVLVAEKIFGQVPCNAWHWASLGMAGGACSMKDSCDHKDCYPADPNLPHPLYSDNKQAALAVLEQMSKLGFNWNLTPDNIQFWEISHLKEHEKPQFPQRHGSANWDQDFNKLPETICRAALQAVGVDLENEAK